jgi:hypothetical protein
MDFQDFSDYETLNFSGRQIESDTAESCALEQQE